MAKQLRSQKANFLRELSSKLRRKPQTEPEVSQAETPSWAEFFEFLGSVPGETVSRDDAAQLLELIFRYGQSDEPKHKAWIIDQTVRVLTGERYEEFVDVYSFEEDFGHSFHWNTGSDPRPDSI